eukprot:45563_1
MADTYSESSSDYDRRQKQRKRGNLNKASKSNKRHDRRDKDDDDDDSDYERYHRKKRKGIPVKSKPKPKRLQKRPPSDSDSDEYVIPVKKKTSIKKRVVQHETSDSADIPSKPKAKSKHKPIIKPPTKRKKKVRKVQSAKVEIKSGKKKGKKNANKGRPKSKKVGKKNAKKLKIKATTPTPKSKSKTKAKPSSVRNLKTGTPTPVRKKKKRMRKAMTMTEREMNLDQLFRDDDQLIGNTIDLSEYALDSKKRQQIKAEKNATYGGFRVKINYRYRLDDNRIGWCRFFGIPLFAKASETWIGLVIQYNGAGENDGSVQNKSYFRCRDGKGLFVRPFRLIEDLGINTRQLTKKEIDGSDEMKQLIKDIKAGKKPIHPNVIKQRQKEREKAKKEQKRRTVKLARRNKVKTRRKPLKQRSKTVTNLDDQGEWKPPDWVHDVDQDHGYDILADRPFHSKGYLEKHKWKDTPASVTAFNKKNHY